MRRELTCIEKIGYYIDQIIAFNMVCGLSLDTAICPSIVKKTLKILIKNHPVLKSKTIDDENILYNVILENTDVDLIVTDNTATIEDQMEDELHRPFKEHEAKIRARYIKRRNGCDIILTVSHAICDGLGLSQITHEFTHIIDQLLDGVDSPTPTAELSSNTPNDIIDSLLKVNEDSIKQAKQKTTQKNNPSYKTKKSKRTRAIHQLFSVSETKKIINYCNKERIPLNQLLSAAGLLALQTHCTKNSSTGIVINHRTMTSLTHYSRKTHPNPPLSDYHSEITDSYYLNNKTELSDLVTLLKKDLKTALYKRTPVSNKSKEAQSFKGNIDLEDLSVSLDYVLPTVTLSYLGSLSVESQHAHYTINNVQSLIPTHHHASKHSQAFFTAYCFNNQLYLALQYTHPDMGEQQAEKIALDVKCKLVNVCKAKNINLSTLANVA
jgi:hypothetical protein